MTYSSWQLGKLLLGILAYRAIKAKSGKVPTWDQVRDAILLSKATKQSYPRDGNLPRFKSEALRRFAAGQQNSMGDDRLDDVKRFLIEENILTEDEFREESSLVAEALVIHLRIATVNDQGIGQLIALPALLQATRRGTEATETIILRVIAKPLPSLYLLEEEYRYEQLGTKRSSVAKTFRRGYAFASTEQAVINIYCRSEDRQELIQYHQIFPYGRQDRGPEIHLIRSGGPDIGGYVKDAMVAIVLFQSGMATYRPDERYAVSNRSQLFL